MPIEIAREGVQQIAGLYKSVPVQAQIKVNTAESVSMRQDLPSSVQNEAYSNKEQDDDAAKITIEKKVNNLNSQVQNFQRDLQFSVDTDSGRTIIRVIDSETRETIRTIPSEDISLLAQRLESHTGALFNTSV
ncbi:MAG: flagellar protein FlaG [Planctomycetota bacterium]|jgi:flagellar protein FlaG